MNSLRKESGVLHDSLRSALGPSLADKVFIAILVPSGDASGPLCLDLGDGKRCLLLFSSMNRANYYGAEVLGRGEPLQILSMSAEEVLTNVRSNPDEATSWVTFDRCPACDAQALYDLKGLRTAELFLESLRVFSSTRMATANLHMARARALFERGELIAARNVLLDVIECVDVDRPDAHLLLGKCAVRLHDERLLAQVEDFLTVFDPGWREKLQEFKRAKKTP